MTEGNPTVEEARAEVLARMRYADSPATSGYDIDRESVHDLIEAVRQEERERYEHDLSTTWKDLALESQRQVRELLARLDGACLECGGGGVGLVRTGNAYEHFDQGDYTIVDCDACAGTGRVERGEV